jgi:predicted dehydrogenase
MMIMHKQEFSPQAKSKLKVGVVGVGYLGKFHAEKYARHPGVELIGVADTDYAQADRIAGQLGTRAYYGHHELIGKVDAVSIAVPTEAHYSISRDFIDNQVDILIEKPITTTIAQADELIRAADKNGCIIQVGHLERFNPAVVALQGVVHSPLFIESHRLSMFKERGLDVSVVLDLMIHDIDLILNFVRSGVQTIRAAGVPVITGTVDIANARLEFENGCIANVTASRISMKNERKIRLFQKDAYVSVNFANREITIVRQDGPKNQGIIPGMTIDQRSFSQADALDDEIQSFINAVIERKKPEVTGRMGRDALSIALSIMEQIQRASDRLKDSIAG